MMTIRGIRGAITIEQDTEEEVLSASKEMLKGILDANPGLIPDDIASVLFTSTADVTSAYPAAAARQIGWNSVPLMCASEIPVPESLPMCIRVLIHWNTNQPQESIQHIYMKEAKKLRPDIAP
jgi:chorismate mutase